MQDVRVIGKKSDVGNLTSELLFVRSDRCVHVSNPKSLVPISSLELALESRQQIGQQQQNRQILRQNLEAFKHHAAVQ